MRLSQITARLEHQRTLMNLIETAVDNLTKVGELNITPQRVIARLTSLKENWKQFSLQHQEINLNTSELSRSDRSRLRENLYFVEDFYSLTHERYLEAVEQMNSFLEPELFLKEPIQSSSSIQSVTQTSSIPTFVHHAQLPRIDLPKFDGSQAGWLPFKDLFNSLVIMNPRLTSVEKLQYLKTSLVGIADPLLKNTVLTADNFENAWEALMSFYENKRLLVDTALHSLLTLKRMKQESACELEQLYTNMMQIYRTLDTLERPVQYWDDFLVYIAVHRLDAESVKAWEHHIGPSKDPPSWNQFSQFLVTRLLSLKAFEKSHGRRLDPRLHQISAESHFQGKSKDNKTTKFGCSICSAKHYISCCPKYIAKSVSQRLAIIAKHQLCFNCLGTHPSSACRIAKRCVKCGRKHHTSIHKKEKPSNQSDSVQINHQSDSVQINDQSDSVQIKSEPLEEDTEMQ